MATAFRHARRSVHGTVCAVFAASLVASPALCEVFIRAGQMGYLPDDPKFALVLSREAIPDRFTLINVKAHEVAFENRIRRTAGSRWGKFEGLAELDFSTVRAPGEYRLRIGDSESLPLRIGEDVFADLPALSLQFMRQQRCGYNPWLDAECHQHDGRSAYGPQAAGTKLDARGGWHDAADLLKYLLTSSNATAQMLLAWQVARFDEDKVDAMGRPAPNGMPDLLDEAHWGLEWMLKLHLVPDQLYHQVADDRDHCGWRLPKDDQADYGWGKGGARVVYFADAHPQGLGQYRSESDGLANLAGRYAAAMALAYQIWRDDPRQAAFAGKCLQAGREVYLLGRRREGVQQGNSYGAPYRYAETTWSDDMEWGAAELYRATGEEWYLSDALRYARLAGDECWMGRDQTGHYQFYPFVNLGHYRLYDHADAETRKVLSGYYRAGIERCNRIAEKHPFGLGVPHIWCSNNLVVALVTQCVLFERMTRDTSYRDFAVRQRDWLLGRNPWGYTMITSAGSVFPSHVHLMTSRLTGRSVGGGLVDGPVRQEIFRSLKGVAINEPDPLGEFQDPLAVYHDDIGDYSTNEPTMDGTASLILMWAVLHPAGSRR